MAVWRAAFRGALALQQRVCSPSSAAVLSVSSLLRVPASVSASAVRLASLTQVRHMAVDAQGVWTPGKGEKREPGDGQPCRVVVVTSGKGGVGKTTTSASFAFGLAKRGFRVCVIDFDIGLRNLDLHLGCERRVIFDFVNVIRGECQLHQALIKDKRIPTLSLLAASQTRDKSALSTEGVAKVIDDLKKEFDFVVCDSPAGIEQGATQAMYFSDDAIMCTNPELASVRDADKMCGLILSKSMRAIENRDPVRQYLLITRYDAARVQQHNMISVNDIAEMLGLPLLGVIPDSKEVLNLANIGQPVINDSDASVAYDDFVARYVGEDRPLQFVLPKSKGILSRIFGSGSS